MQHYCAELYWLSKTPKKLAKTNWEDLHCDCTIVQGASGLTISYLVSQGGNSVFKLFLSQTVHATLLTDIMHTWQMNIMIATKCVFALHGDVMSLYVNLVGLDQRFRHYSMRCQLIYAQSKEIWNPGNQHIFLLSIICTNKEHLWQREIRTYQKLRMDIVHQWAEVLHKILL